MNKDKLINRYRFLTEYEQHQLFEAGQIYDPVTKEETPKDLPEEFQSGKIVRGHKERCRINCDDCGFKEGDKIKDNINIANCGRCGTACDIIEY